MKSIFQKIGLVCAALLVVALRAEPIAGAVVIAHADVPVAGLSADALKDIYTGKTTYWPDGQRVVIVVLADATDAALKEASGMDPSQFRTFWQRLVFSGRGQQPKKAENATALVALVAATKGAIALVPAATELHGVKQLELQPGPAPPAPARP